MSHIKIEGVWFSVTAGKAHTLKEFKDLHKWLKEPEKAYKALGGIIQKAKAVKDSEE